MAHPAVLTFQVQAVTALPARVAEIPVRGTPARLEAVLLRQLPAPDLLRPAIREVPLHLPAAAPEPAQAA